MNSDEVWLLQLWSGAIGSFVAAVLGGLVALIVVRLTNRQQRNNAAEAREIEAIAEFISTVQTIGLSFTNRERFAHHEFMLNLSKAVMKLHLAGPSVKELAQALDLWPMSMVNLGLAYHVATDRNLELPVDVRKFVIESTITAFYELRNWHHDSDTVKVERVAAMKRTGDEMRRHYLTLDALISQDDADEVSAANSAR